MKRVFKESGDFAAYYAACTWLEKEGFSVGEMCNISPIGIKKGSYDIAKWRYLTEYDKQTLDGKMTGDMRNGPVIVEIF